MRRNFGAAVAAVTAMAVSACVAEAQVATWYWTVSDTGNGDGLVEPGESALLTLWVGFNPRQDQAGGGFAWAGPYDVVGNDTWAWGTVEQRLNLLDGHGGYDNGTLDDDNSIRAIQHAQLPDLFQQGLMNSDNPIKLFFVRWTPSAYAKYAVELDNGGPDASIYTDVWGTNIPYSGAGGSVTFHIVPAPASAAAFGVCALAALRRRR